MFLKAVNCKTEIRYPERDTLALYFLPQGLYIRVAPLSQLNPIFKNLFLPVSLKKINVYMDALPTYVSEARSCLVTAETNRGRRIS